MAKNRRRRGMRGLKGSAKGLLPVATGAVLTGATALGLRAFLRPEPGAVSEKLYQHAPWVGVGAGLLGGVGLYFMAGKGSKKAGMDAAWAAGLTSLAVGGVLFASERLNASRAIASGTAGLGAILPEYAPQHDGLGAIVMEPLSGAYGESVNVNGLGAGYNPAAFGTSPF